MNGLRDDGVVFIATLTDKSLPGEKPVEVLVKIARHFFEERNIGFTRQYEANSAKTQVDMVIRIGFERKVRIGLYAILGNGEQFRIENSTHYVDSDTGLKYTELTLRRLDHSYDLSEDQ